MQHYRSTWGTPGVLVTILVAFLTACGGATGVTPPPLGHDPSVLIRNTSLDAAVVISWVDQTAHLDTLGYGDTGTPILWWRPEIFSDTVPPNTTRCSRFIASADSSLWEAHWYHPAELPRGGQAWTYSNWFNPLADSAWTIEARPTGISNVEQSLPC